MDSEDFSKEARLSHIRFQNQKKDSRERERKQKELREEQERNAYKLRSKTYEQDFHKGSEVAMVSGFPVFIHSEILQSSNYQSFNSKVSTALSQTSFAPSNAQVGIKFLVDDKDKHLKTGRGEEIVELKILGEQQNGSISAGDWRVLGVLDRKQKCIFLLKEAIGHLTIKAQARKIQTDFSTEERSR